MELYTSFYTAYIKETGYKKYVSQFFILGFHSMLTTMYTSFNVAYLGFVTNPTEVGYYTTATKLYTIIIALYSAFTGVMLPRISALLSEGKEEEFKSLIHKSIGVLFLYSYSNRYHCLYIQS